MLLLLTAPRISASSTNPIPGLTGAPSENLCIDCHASFPVNSGPGSLTIIAPTVYTLNQIYPVRVRIMNPGQSRWGFQLTALNTANAMAGTIIVTAPNHTQSQYAPFLDRSYINHTDVGTYANVQNGPVEWTFEWRAPAANVGVITFYASGIASDQNSAPTGDFVYTATATAAPIGGGDSLRFRTFRPDSLLERRMELRKPVASGWRAAFRNTTGFKVSSLEIRFRKPVTLTGYAPFPDSFTPDDGKTWVISGQFIVDGDSLVVSGIGPKDFTEISRWRFGTDETGSFLPGFIPIGQKKLLPMPNTANVRTEVFQYGGFAPGTPVTDMAGGMVLGKAFMQYRNFKWRVDADSARKYGWVRIRKQSDVYRTLRAGNARVTHLGIPRGFCGFDNGRAFVRQQNNLPPTKMNNKLVAEMVALKLNIAASAMGVTPPGFGELIYDNDGHPFDEKMLREIAARVDSLVTYCNNRPLEVYAAAEQALRAVNGAFSGALDTLSFADSLVLTGVRSVSEVPFLRANFDVPAVRIERVLDPEFDDEGEMEDDPAVPEMIQVGQNYPNPFNPSTTIQFELNEFALVTVKVYNLLGQEVAVLAREELHFDGTNEVAFDAGELSSGVYVYRISAQSVEDPGRHMEFTGKMLLLK